MAISLLLANERVVGSTREDVCMLFRVLLFRSTLCCSMWMKINQIYFMLIHDRWEINAHHAEEILHVSLTLQRPAEGRKWLARIVVTILLSTVYDTRTEPIFIFSLLFLVSKLVVVTTQKYKAKGAYQSSSQLRLQFRLQFCLIHPLRW